MKSSCKPTSKNGFPVDTTTLPLVGLLFLYPFTWWIMKTSNIVIETGSLNILNL